jgi:hypothetical protein
MSVTPASPWAVQLPRAIVAVSGPDTDMFLQGLISNDIAKSGPGRLVYAFLLSPQGKYLFDFFIRAVEGGVELDTDQEGAEALRLKLAQYKLRSKVAVALRDDAVVVALGGGANAPGALPDPRTPELGLRVTVSRIDARVLTATTPPAGYDALRIALGVPDHQDFVRDQSFLLECNGEELNAVDFRKGCYVGQELTARMKHRGTARRRILRVSGGGLATGATILDGAREIGTLLSVAGTQGLATVRLDRWREAGGRILTVNGQPAELSLPVYPMSLPAEETPS